LRNRKTISSDDIFLPRHICLGHKSKRAIIALT